MGSRVCAVADRLAHLGDLALGVELPHLVELSVALRRPGEGIFRRCPLRIERAEPGNLGFEPSRVALGGEIAQRRFIHRWTRWIRGCRR